MESNKINDIISYGELEKYLYGGYDSVSFFNRDIQKSMPFVQTPIELKKSNGTANFGYTWSVVVDNNLGDYLSKMWICLELPEIKLKHDNTFGDNGAIRWTENIFHNLINEITLSFNDNVVSKIDSFILDFISEFFINTNKYPTYIKKIGNIPELVLPNKILISKKILLPLPLFFCKDTTNSIPLTALTNTEIKINVTFKNWNNLLILDNITSVNPCPHIPVVDVDIVGTPEIKICNLYGIFISVSEEERRKIGLKPITLLIENFQTSPRQMVCRELTTQIPLLFKNNTTALMWAVKNSTFPNDHSNYNYDHDRYIGGIFMKNNCNEIIDTVSIKYGEKIRVPESDNEFYSYIVPYYNSLKIPNKHGLMMYSFALNLRDIEPNGGVNLHRITNPTLNIKFHSKCLNNNQNFELVVIAISNNIVKISEGVLHFPAI